MCIRDSGKTTLLNVLSGIDEPTSGTVMIDNKSLFAVSDDERSRIRAEYLGFIFQDFNLLPVLSAVENVELPLLLLGKSATESRSTALEALKAVGLADRSEHRRQRQMCIRDRNQQCKRLEALMSASVKVR